MSFRFLRASYFTRFFSFSLPTIALSSVFATVDPEKHPERAPIVIGATMMDIIAEATTSLKIKSSNEGAINRVKGGVGRNVAEVLSRLGHKPLLISAVGCDEDGKQLLEHAQFVGINTSHILRSFDYNTARYVAVLDEKGAMDVGVADMDILSLYSTKKYLFQHERLFRHCSIMVIDGDLPDDAIQWIISICTDAHIPVWFQPVSTAKVSKCISKEGRLDGISYISPNQTQFFTLLQAIKHPDFIDFNIHNSQKNFSIEQLSEYGQYLISLGCSNVIIDLNGHGVIVVNQNGSHYVPSDEIEGNTIVNRNGFSDNLVGGLIAGILDGKSLEDACNYGLAVAKTNLYTEQTVNPDLHWWDFMN